MPLEHFVAVAVLCCVGVIESKLGFYIADDRPLYNRVAFVLDLCGDDTAE